MELPSHCAQSLWKTDSPGSDLERIRAREEQPLLAPRLRGRRALLVLLLWIPLLLVHVWVIRELVFRVRLLTVHVCQLLEPGPEVVQIVELEIGIGRSRV